MCGALGGATDAIAGQRLNYGCKNGDVYGNVDRSTPVWTVFYRATGAAELVKVLVVEATF
ncbi:MAG: hypothetical protein JWM02_705 [Frankiales bacterium]|nr:hypothetical protein [Frankiales bacterium]